MEDYEKAMFELAHLNSAADFATQMAPSSSGCTVLIN
jgi:hypothetical protein